jgi:hypothetical protein
MDDSQNGDVVNPSAKWGAIAEERAVCQAKRAAVINRAAKRPAGDVFERTVANARGTNIVQGSTLTA